INNSSSLVTVWVQGRYSFGGAVLNLTSDVSNRGEIHLESSDYNYKSDVATGSFTLTNLGTISAAPGSGGERLITGNVNNSGMITVEAGTWLSTTGAGNVFNQNAGTI